MSSPQQTLPGSAGDAEPLLAALEAAWHADAVAWLDRAALLADLHDLCADHDHAVGELALLLRASPLTAGRLLADALELRRRPQLTTAVRAGRIDQTRARVVLDQLAGCPDDHITALVLDDLLAGDRPIDKTPAQLRTWLTGRLIAADPEEAAERRREQTRQRTGIRLRALGDGLAEAVLTGPVDALLGLTRALDAALPPPDATRLVTRGQQQLATFLSLFRAGADQAGIAAPAVELRLDLPCETTNPTTDGWRTEVDGRPLAQPEPLEIRCTAGGLQQIVAALQTVLAELHLLAQPAGRRAGPPGPADGPPPPPAPRRPVPGRPGSWVDPRTGEILDPEPSDDLDDLDIPSTCDPEVDAHPDLEAARPTAHSRGLPALVDLESLRAALTSLGSWPRAALPVELLPTLTGYGILDPDHAARILLRHTLGQTAALRPPSGASRKPRMPHVRRVLLEPLIGACAVDTRPLPLDQIAIAPLPQPPAPTGSYRFTTDQARVLRARDTTCTHPGCRRPAARCDLDHLVPWPAGPTSVGNAAPKCRHHHGWKHAGWTVTRFPDGTETWTTPLGRTYRRRPGD
jgi:hypothetical protein